MAQPTRDREQLISSFASKLFSAMLEEVIMDVALQSHKETVRSKAICDVCGTRCGSVHTQGALSNGAGPSASTSVLHPAPGSPASAGKTVAGTSTPNAKDKSDGNIYFECTNCQKKIASNRYAPHLSGCLGIGTGSRRGAARNAAAKNKLSAEVDRSASPYVGSDYGSPTQEPVNGKKGKAKNSKKINGKAADFEINGNHKRLMTPDGPQPKKSKKQKASAPDSDTASLVPDESIAHKGYVPTPTQILTKVGTTSPYAAGSPGSGASVSHYSGRNSPSASASGSSHNAQSPGSKPLRTYKTISDSQKRGRRPPSSVKNQAAATEAAAIRKTEEKEEDPDFIDVDGEDQEEGSSDSS